MKALKTPLRVEQGSTMGVPRIVDAYGKPVCSFGNQARHRGYDWAWKAAAEIVEAVNTFRKAEVVG